jgi:hypothetical protein
MESIRKLDFERHMDLLRKEARDGQYARKDFDQHQLDKLTKLARQFLGRRICAACDMPLDRTGCGSYMMPSCPWQGRWKRRRRCLQAYKPRPPWRSAYKRRAA